MLRKFARSVAAALGGSKTPEDALLTKLDEELAIFAKSFQAKIESAISQQRMATELQARFETVFSIETWEALAAQEFQRLHDEDPERFKRVIRHTFNQLADKDFEESHVFRLDLDLHNEEPKSIDYFTGFERMPGYQAFMKACADFGLDFEIFYGPVDGEQAQLAFTLWSVDGKLLMDCMRNPQPITVEHLMARQAAQIDTLDT